MELLFFNATTNLNLLLITSGLFAAGCDCCRQNEEGVKPWGRADVNMNSTYESMNRTSRSHGSVLVWREVSSGFTLQRSHPTISQSRPPGHWLGDDLHFACYIYIKKTEIDDYKNFWEIKFNFRLLGKNWINELFRSFV